MDSVAHVSCSHDMVGAAHRGHLVTPNRRGHSAGNTCLPSAASFVCSAAELASARQGLARDGKPIQEGAWGSGAAAESDSAIYLQSVKAAQAELDVVRQQQPRQLPTAQVLIEELDEPCGGKAPAADEGSTPPALSPMTSPSGSEGQGGEGVAAAKKGAASGAAEGISAAVDINDLD